MKLPRATQGATAKIALLEEINRSNESRYDHRLHAVLLVYHGFSPSQVAGLLGQHPTTIDRWVQRFQNQGFRGLREGLRGGRPRRIKEILWDKIERDLRQNPSTFGYPQHAWNGKLLAQHLKTVYRLDLGVRQCQRLLRSLRFSAPKDRPHLRRAGPKIQVPQ